MQKSLFHIFWVFLSCLSVTGWGQVTSPLGRFQVDLARGCAPLTVSITDLLGGPTAGYLYDADTCVVGSPKYNPALCPPTNTAASTTYTYTQPGTYSLVQVVASQIPRGDTIVIEVLPVQAPQFNVTLCNNYGVSVNITDTYYDQFLIDYGDGSPSTQATLHSYLPGTLSYPVTVSGSFNNGPLNCGAYTEVITPVNTLPAATFSQVAVTQQSQFNGSVEMEFVLNPNVVYELQGTANSVAGFPPVGKISGTSYTLSGLAVNTQDSIYCFRIAALDLCGGTPVYSDTLCTTSIQVMAQEGQNLINWNTFVTSGFGQYEVIKNGILIGPPITGSATKNITDTAINCDAEYCYQAITVYNNGGRSLSTESCVTGINNLPPAGITSLTASVNESTITINWQAEASISSYQVFRSVNNGPFELAGQSTTLPYEDVNLRPQINHYCYYIVYQNTCGKQSDPSVIACAIRLTGSNMKNQYYDLQWTPYSGWDRGIADYQLEIMDATGAPVGPPVSLGANAISYSDPITQNRQISQYRILALSNDSIPYRSYSNIIMADIPLQIFIPNSFTPNNDGLNDTFTAKGLFIDQFSMEIYNRWGELLYHTSDLERGWDGVYKGTLSPEDTYVYLIQATDTNGREMVKNGTVHLLRKD